MTCGERTADAGPLEIAVALRQQGDDRDRIAEFGGLEDEDAA